MPREPELSIKVKVDPHVDPQQTRDTIQKKINDIKNPPTVVIKPDLSKFDNFIKDDLGGDHSVDITPNITGDKYEYDTDSDGEYLFQDITNKNFYVKGPGFQTDGKSLTKLRNLKQKTFHLILRQNFHT